MLYVHILILTSPSSPQSVHNTENIYSKIGQNRSHSLDRAAMGERQSPEMAASSAGVRRSPPRMHTAERRIEIKPHGGGAGQSNNNGAAHRTQSLGELPQRKQSDSKGDKRLAI